MDDTAFVTSTGSMPSWFCHECPLSGFFVPQDGNTMFALPAIHGHVHILCWLASINPGLNVDAQNKVPLPLCNGHQMLCCAR